MYKSTVKVVHVYVYVHVLLFPSPSSTPLPQRACSLLEVTFPEEESSDEEYNPAAESFSEEEEEEGSEGEGEWMEAGHSLSAVEHLQTQKGERV